MPEFTQTFTAVWGAAMDGDSTNYINSSTAVLRMLNGHNLGHSRHIVQGYKMRGPNNALGGNMDFTPDQVTKVEVKVYFSNTWHQNGRATNNAQTFFMTHTPTTEYRPYILWQQQYGSSASGQPLPNTMSNWPTPDGWSDWLWIDDGTDLRTHFAGNPNWDTATDDSSVTGGAIAPNVVFKMSVAGEAGHSDGAYFIDIPNWGTAQASQLRITYESQPDFTAIDSRSLSGTHPDAVVNLAGEPECFGRWHGDQPEVLTKAALFPLQTAGSGDLPITRLEGTENPNGYNWAVWANGGLHPAEVCARLYQSWTDPPPTGGLGRPSGNYNIHMENYSAATGYICYDTDTWRSKTGPVSTASGRFSIRHDGLPGSGDANPIALRAFKNGQQIFEFTYRTYYYELLGNKYFSHQVRVENNIDNIISGWSDTRYLLDWHTWEFQISNDLDSGQLKVRFYNEWTAGPTPDEEWTINFTDASFDELQWGLTHTSLASATADCYINDIDLWDDYYLNGFWKDEGNHGKRYEFTPWEEYEFDGTDWNPIDFHGQVTATDPLTIDENFDFDPLRDFEGFRWMYDDDTNTNLQYTKYDSLYYGFGGTHRMDIRVPNTPTPPGGRRTFVYLHGGFFVSGTEDNIPQGLIAELILQEYVIVSLQVMLSSIDPVVNRVLGVQPQGYPAYDYNANSATARHPTQILDYKMAVAWLQETAQRTTYGLNGEVVVGGHSAGGYPALMAMLTKDVANDGSNTSYRLQDSTYGHPNVPDPDILGCYVWSPPTDFASIRTFDPTERLGLLYGNTGQYTMETTIQLYWGMNFGAQPSSAQLTGSSCAYHIANSPLANIKPVAYSGGETDYLVPAVDMQGYSIGQATKLEDAYAARGISDRFTKVLQAETQHYQSPYRFDVIHLLEFLNSL